MTGDIRVGIGGWSFPPWRGVFYPKGVRQKDELAFASRSLRVIEINSTAQSFHPPETFARWADETPENFVFNQRLLRVSSATSYTVAPGKFVR